MGKIISLLNKIVQNLGWKFLLKILLRFTDKQLMKKRILQENLAQIDFNVKLSLF